MSRSNQQQTAVKNWFKEYLNVQSGNEQKAIIKEFCDYTGFEPPRSARNKAIRQTRWDAWRLQWIIKRWSMFELWIREEIKKAQTQDESNQSQVKTPAESLMDGMVTV
jgi:hypothetical protein